MARAHSVYMAWRGRSIFCTSGWQSGKSTGPNGISFHGWRAADQERLVRICSGSLTEGRGEQSGRHRGEIPLRLLESIAAIDS